MNESNVSHSIVYENIIRRLTPLGVAKVMCKYAPLNKRDWLIQHCNDKPRHDMAYASRLSAQERIANKQTHIEIKNHSSIF